MISHQTSSVAILLSALSLGLVSSLHCIGMCGPLACHAGSRPGKILLYQLGRLLSYQILALALYFLASSLLQALTPNIQVAILYILGLLYLLIGISLILKKNLFNLKLLPQGLYQKAFPRGKNIPFVLGLISALLPCGLLHAVLLEASMLPSAVLTCFYVFCFWLASAPSLITSALSFKIIKNKIKFSAGPLFGLIYILTGLYLIYIRQATLLHGEHGH